MKSKHYHSPRSKHHISPYPAGGQFYQKEARVAATECLCRHYNLFDGTKDMLAGSPSVSMM
jgi:hypothetical protein